MVSTPLEMSEPTGLPRRVGSPMRSSTSSMIWKAMPKLRPNSPNLFVSSSGSSALRAPTRQEQGEQGRRLPLDGRQVLRRALGGVEDVLGLHGLSHAQPGHGTCHIEGHGLSGPSRLGRGPGQEEGAGQ